MVWTRFLDLTHSTKSTAQHKRSILLLRELLWQDDLFLYPRQVVIVQRRVLLLFQADFFKEFQPSQMKLSL